MRFQILDRSRHLHIRINHIRIKLTQYSLVVLVEHQPHTSWLSLVEKKAALHLLPPSTKLFQRIFKLAACFFLMLFLVLLVLVPTSRGAFDSYMEIRLDTFLLWMKCSLHRMRTRSSGKWLHSWKFCQKLASVETDRLWNPVIDSVSKGIEMHRSLCRRRSPKYCTSTRQAAAVWDAAGCSHLLMSYKTCCFMFQE